MSQHVAVELLSSYVDEEVTPTQMRLVEDHLSVCTDCRRTLDGLRAVAAGVRRLEAVAPPPTLAATVERRTRLEALETSRRFRVEDVLRRWTGQPVLAPAFAIVLALGAILYLFAVGVAKHGGTATRMVVASVPGEKANEPATTPVDSKADFEILAQEGQRPSRGRADRSGSSLAAHGNGGFETSVATDELLESDAPLEPPVAETVSERTTHAGVARQAEDELSIDGVSKLEARKQSIPETASRARRTSFATEVLARRSLAGRTFVKQVDVWVEVGLEGGPAELLDFRAASARLKEELLAFQELGRVRLRLDDRIVEVTYPAGETRD